MTWGRPTPFFLGHVERQAWAQPIDQPVGDLGGNDLVTQPMGADRVGMLLLASAAGKAAISSPSMVGSSASFSSSAASFR